MARHIPKSNSYALRVNQVNAIYNYYIKQGLSNREIFDRYVYPCLGISERTFYSYLKKKFHQ